MKQRFAFTILTLLLFTGASCNVFGSSSAGIWYSPDAGQTWEQRSRISYQGQEGTLAGSVILDIDASNATAAIMYAATDGRGVYKTEDKGESWFPVSTGGSIPSLDVGRDSAQRVVASMNDQIFFTENGGEEWKLVYTNPSASVIVDVVFHPTRSNTLYAATNTGILIESMNDGRTWQRLADFEEPVRSVSLNAESSENIYVLTSQQLQKSTDGGETFSATPNPLEDSTYFYGSEQTLRQLLIHPNTTGSLLLSTSQGVYLSEDGGGEWRELPILTRDDEVQIRTIGWNPRDAGEMYYATSNVLYKSETKGDSWQTIPFPTAIGANTFFIHPQATEELFLGAISL